MNPLVQQIEDLKNTLETMNSDLTSFKTQVAPYLMDLDNLKQSSTIPLAFDQAFRERFGVKNKYILYVGTATTAGNQTLNITGLRGVTTTDVAFAVLNTKGLTPVTITTTKSNIEQIDIIFSGNPASDHIVSYLVIRP